MAPAPISCGPLRKMALSAPGAAARRRIIDHPSQRGTALFAKINHIAIVSEKYALLASFYESLFGMKRSPTGKINRAITVGDGYVGLNINPRKPGRPAGLDHFGVEVEDVDTVFDRTAHPISGRRLGATAEHAAVRRHHRQ